MNCFYHPDKRAETQCSGCGKNLCEQCSVAQKNGSALCSRCIALGAAEDASRGIESRIAEKERQAELKAARKYKRRRSVLLAQYLLIIIGLIVMAIQAPRIIALFEKEKPLRHGTYDTDSLTDQCIMDLWEISKLLQEGRLPGDDVLCPASERPYEIIKSDSDVIVRSPNPELYGFREIRVSKLKPVPELIK